MIANGMRGVLVGGQALRGVRQEELVRLFDRVAAINFLRQRNPPRAEQLRPFPIAADRLWFNLPKSVREKSQPTLRDTGPINTGSTIPELASASAGLAREASYAAAPAVASAFRAALS